MSLDAMKQALAALENSRSYVEFDWVQNQCGRAITALSAAIEYAERPQTHSEECWRWHHECAVAKIERLQEGAETLHAMYEQACQQRDQLMNQQSAQIAAMRGRMQ